VLEIVRIGASSASSALASSKRAATGKASRGCSAWRSARWPFVVVDQAAPLPFGQPVQNFSSPPDRTFDDSHSRPPRAVRAHRLKRIEELDCRPIAANAPAALPQARSATRRVPARYASLRPQRRISPAPIRHHAGPPRQAIAAARARGLGQQVAIAGTVRSNRFTTRGEVLVHDGFWWARHPSRITCTPSAWHCAPQPPVRAPIQLSAARGQHQRFVAKSQDVCVPGRPVTTPLAPPAVPP